MKKKKLSIQASIIWNSTGSIIYLFTQWLITVLVVRIAGVEVAGDLTLAMSVNNIYYSIAMQGIRNYQVSDVEEKYDAGTYINSRIISCFIALCLCMGYCMLIGYSTSQKGCIIVYCLFKISEAMYDVYGGICQKSWRMDYIGKSWIIRGILTLLGFCGGLFLTSSLFYAILCMAFMSFVVIFMYDIPKAKELVDIKSCWSDNKKFLLMKECFPLLCYLILSSTIPTIPRIFLERVLGSYALGVYGSVAAPTLIVQMGASYIFNPFMTLFAEQYNSGKVREFLHTLKKCFIAICILSIVALIGGKVLGRWGLNFLYGKEIAAYVHLLMPLIVCTILTAVVWMMCGLLTVVRNFKGLIVSNLVALAISFGCSIAFINLFEIQGASVALMLSLSIEIICLFIFLLKKLHIKERESCKQM